MLDVFFCGALLGLSGGALLCCLVIAGAMSLTHRSYRRDWKTGDFVLDSHPMSAETHHRAALKLSQETGVFYRRQP